MKNFDIKIKLSLVSYFLCVLFFRNALAEEITLSKHPVVIIISYDGFRYDYLENKTETPNLLSIKHAGVSVPYMNNQFLTFTFPNHHSISTGLYVESHGVVANALYDPLYGELSGYNDDPGFWNYSSNVVPLWALNEQRGDERYSGVMMWPGSFEPYNNTLSTYRKKYDKYYKFEQRVDDVIGWITNKEKPANLVFLYFEEPDSTGHSYGPEGNEIKGTIKQMDDLTGYIMGKLNELNITDRVNLMFLSDHGMQEVRVEPQFIINFESIVSSENNTKYEQHGSTPVLQILPKRENETEEIYQAFKAASATANFSAFRKEDLKTAKPHWHYADSRRIMPIILVADSPYLFEDYDRNDKTHPWGVHGYDNLDMEMRPYFMALGPIFKGNGSIQPPFENIDIFPLICELMDIPTPGHNGSISNIGPILSPAYLSKIGINPEGGDSGLTVGQILAIVGGLCAVVLIAGVILWRRRQRNRSQTLEMH